MIPMMITGRVGSIATSAEVSSVSGVATTRVRHTVSFQPDFETNIVLSDGTRLSEHLIELAFFCGTQSSSELDGELSTNEVGYLSISKVQGGEVLLGGAVCWPGSASVLSGLRGVNGAVIQLVMSNVAAGHEYDPPYVWQVGRPGMLRISDVSLSAKG